MLMPHGLFLGLRLHFGNLLAVEVGPCVDWCGSFWSCSSAPYLVRGIWSILLRVFQAALPTWGISSLGAASLVPSSCSQSTSPRPSPRSNDDDALGSSCGFSLLGSSSSVIFTTSTKSAIISKPLAYRTTICAGMIFSEAAMTLASVQSSGSSSSWCRSSSGLPLLILSWAASRPAASILPLCMFG